MSESTPAKAVHIDSLDYLLSFIYCACYLVILLGYDILQRIALFCFGHNAHDRVIYALNFDAVGLFQITNTRLKISGAAPDRADKPYIIVANHQALSDIPMLYTVFPALKCRYIAKKELANWLPAISFNLRRGLNALIDRKDPRQALEQIQTIGRHMRERRFATVIFPEGTRAKDGVMKKFRTAGVVSLMEAVPEAEVIPVALDNSWKLMAHGFILPRNIEVPIMVGPILKREDFSSNREVVKAAEKWISEAIANYRKVETHP